MAGHADLSNRLAEDSPLPVERREYLLVTEQTEIGIMHLLDSAQGLAQLKRECSL